MKFSFILFLIMITLVQSCSGQSNDPVTYLKQSAVAVKSADDLCQLIARTENSRFVLLGEASHGTHEYYLWRKRISKRLIEENDFSFIAVEGDWNAAFQVNRYVKNLPGAAASASEAVSSFKRWPQWMWANEETIALAEWLREYNMNRPPEKRAGFYGIDVYGFDESMDEVIAYLKEHHPQKVDAAQGAYSCLTPFRDNMHDYVHAVLQGATRCTQQVNSVVELIESLQPKGRCPNHFSAMQNAIVVKNAEAHFRAMGSRDQSSWNYRVDNFKSTVERLVDFYSPQSRAIVWAHNTHVGDARATSMANQGMNNIGKLLRENHGEEGVYIVGFSTNRGEVVAGSSWGSPKQIMNVPAAMEGSAEHLFLQTGIPQALYFFGDSTPEQLFEIRGHRAKGVVYNPAQERGNYVPTILPKRYNAFFFIEQTSALRAVR